MQVWSSISKNVSAHGKCALVTQLTVEGSAPREAGARMLVMPDGTFTGTIGGGALEWRALAMAQKALRDSTAKVEISRHALGPELGQCCGGVSRLMVEVFDAGHQDEIDLLKKAETDGPFSTQGVFAKDRITRRLIDRLEAGIVWDGNDTLTETFGHSNRAVYLFGAGHVGRALMLAMAPLPFEVIWVDPRNSQFPAAVPANVQLVQADDPATLLGGAPDGSFIVVLTHSHALDLDLVQTALKAERFEYVGVIGSATKRARFSSRMRKAGMEQAQIEKLVCPIGIAGVSAKQPAVIAASVVTELLLQEELVKSREKPQNKMQLMPQAVKLQGRG